MEKIRYVKNSSQVIKKQSSNANINKTYVWSEKKFVSKFSQCEIYFRIFSIKKLQMIKIPMDENNSFK